MNSSDAFNPRTILWAAFASMMAAAAFFLLSTYAPDFRLAGEGDATPLSKSGVGFAGLAKLLTLTGKPPEMARSDDDLLDERLLIVPLRPDTPPKALETLVAHRESKPTLFVLPKWIVAPRLDHAGWDQQIGHLERAAIDKVLGKVAVVHIGWQEGKVAPVMIEDLSVPAPEEMQWLENSEPYIADAADHAIVSQIEGAPHWILADPDFLNNQGLADPTRAAAALRLIQRLQGNDDAVMFDLTLLRAGNGMSLQKLLVEPPFLALTLALIAAAGLAVAHGLVRFGPARAEARAIAFGKYALADTTARLFRRAGRLGSLGGRYAALMRTRAGKLLGAPPGLAGDALDAWLDARDNTSAPRFSELAAATGATTDEARVHARTRALNDWIQRRKRDS
ncbi:MAG: hypothetical protein K2W81_07465 [Sphingomonas sp.]|uniref:hypothetical protein n=1 Tax=Sphingomonas sp. TaxID=28214 RepID=UPI0025D26A7B|nr:hypothetical protein [Sphingomonas sp.]MBY0283789.1 hypothetical protein [Sphingomonas sp.]